MALKIKCDICKKELNSAGALLFGPPVGGSVYKYHICIDCWPMVRELLTTLIDGVQSYGDANKQKMP